jgi:hypothetical protein
MQNSRRQEDHVGMQYPFWYVLAHRRGDRYDLTPLYIGGTIILWYVWWIVMWMKIKETFLRRLGIIQNM